MRKKVAKQLRCLLIPGVFGEINLNSKLQKRSRRTCRSYHFERYKCGELSFKKIEAKQIVFLGRLAWSARADLVPKPKFNKTHTDFLQKTSRRETSNWLGIDLRETSTSDDLRMHTSGGHSPQKQFQEEILEQITSRGVQKWPSEGRRKGKMFDLGGVDFFF